MGGDGLDYSREEIDAAIKQLKEEGLQSDQRFTEAYIRMRARRGFGPQRIELELRERGIEDEMIEELSMGGLGVGDIVRISAFAFVDSKSEHSDKDESNKSIRLQLTSIELQREDSDRAKQLYGGE